jgi:rhamnose utilization protein RhaD (predicted bifunctional aldolase and dehydrogenase)
LHGGGNTSVKIDYELDIGETIQVIAVKGSGWELGNIEPQGFPLVNLEHCRKLRKLSKLDDKDMVNHLRTHMLDYDSPTPSVETLLHGIHRFSLLLTISSLSTSQICGPQPRRLYARNSRSV